MTKSQSTMELLPHIKRLNLGGLFTTCVIAFKKILLIAVLTAVRAKLNNSLSWLFGIHFEISNVL